MHDETRIGGPDGRFPATRLSAVVAARSDDPEERRRALGVLIEAYWKPVYKHLRLRWRRSNEEAKDLTKELFAGLLESGTLQRFDPERARLRTYLKSCVDHLAQNADRAARRQKRGGGAELTLDFDEAEAEFQHRAPGPVGEDLFEREWVRSLFALAVDDLERTCRERGKEIHFRLFAAYDLEEPPQGSAPGQGEAAPSPSYRDLAERFGVSATDVTNRLHWARSELRRLTLERLRSMTASDEEFRREAHSLLGVDPA